MFFLNNRSESGPRTRFAFGPDERGLAAISGDVMEDSIRSVYNRSTGPCSQHANTRPG